MTGMHVVVAVVVGSSSANPAIGSASTSFSASFVVVVVTDTAFVDLFDAIAIAGTVNLDSGATCTCAFVCDTTAVVLRTVVVAALLPVVEPTVVAAVVAAGFVLVASLCMAVVVEVFAGVDAEVMLQFTLRIFAAPYRNEVHLPRTSCQPVGGPSFQSGSAASKTEQLCRPR